VLRRGAPILAAAVAVVALTAAPAGAASRPRCAKGGVTMAETSQVRVYSTGHDESDTVFICSLRTGKRTDVGDYGQCDSVGQAGPPAINGRMVAMGILNCDETGYFASVAVYDAATGKNVHGVDALVGEVTGDPDESVIGLVVATNGDAAWIAQNKGDTLTRQVVKLVGKGGKLTLLDSGPKIGTGSLRFDEGELSWRNRGALKTARL
jgi:hypothetical protein